METSPGFDQAFKDLERLVAEIEDENIQLDSLAQKVKEANRLISFCETRLRSIKAEIGEQEASG